MTHRPRKRAARLFSNRYSNRQMPRARSRGAALILFVLLLVSLGAGVLIEAVIGTSPAPVTRDDRTSRSLAEAKEALLAWAVGHPMDKPELAPGQLPFPDRGSDGFDGVADCVAGAALPVDADDLLGHFPWRGDIENGSQCLTSISTWPMTKRLFDNTGQPLWYAVSDKLVFNGNAPAINPGMLDQDTGGTWLTVRDATGAVLTDASGAPLQIAAVIIAPGKSIGGQNRGMAATDPAHPAQFLDSVTIGGTTYSNADPSDNTFVMYPDSSTTDIDGDGLTDDSDEDLFNDRLVYITAQELLRAIERRVLGEVAIALSVYRQANERTPGTGDGGYPWLSPFADPLGTNLALFDGVPGTRVGHLAFTDPVTETLPGTETYRLDTGFTVSWASGLATPTPAPVPVDYPDTLTIVVDATLSYEIDPSPTETAASNGTQIIAMPTMQSLAPEFDPSCVWRGTEAVVDCYATTSAETSNEIYDVTTITSGVPGSPSSALLSRTRTYTFDLAFNGAPTFPTSNSGARSRDVSSDSPYSGYLGASSTITVRDIVAYPPYGSFELTRRLTIPNGDEATVAVAGIYLEPTIGGGTAGDLPPWFYNNEWQRYVLVKYASNALPAETWDSPGVSPCDEVVLDNCVKVDVEGAAGVRNEVRAVVIGASWQLPNQCRISPAPPPPECPASPPPPSISDYFESGNAIELGVGSSTVQRSAWNIATPFNDQIRIVEPGPLP